jgi:putative nucleotidyltransferase with HDIG domain
MNQGVDQRAELKAVTAAKSQRHEAAAGRNEKREAIARRVKTRFRFADLTQEPIQALCRICILRAIREERDGKPATRPPLTLKERKGLDVGTERPAGSSAEALKPIPDLAALLEGNGGLPTLPVVFSRLVDLLSDEISSAQAIGDVIGADPALSARLLRLANSPYCGIPSRIETISRAVTIIGVKELYSLALTVSVMQAFKHLPHELVDVASFWRHSMACGVISRTIAEVKGLRGRETLFVAGLLHDIGRLLLYQRAPLQAKGALERARRLQIPLRRAEKEVMGTDHAEIGGQVLRRWRFPERLQEMIRTHHDPQVGLHSLESTIIHFSDVVTNALSLGTSGEILVPPFETNARKALNLSPEEIALVVGKSEIKAEEMIGALMGRDPSGGIEAEN